MFIQNKFDFCHIFEETLQKKVNTNTFIKNVATVEWRLFYARDAIDRTHTFGENFS